MKTIVSILLLILPLFVSAQQDTIKIPAPVAKEIVKDLVKCDSTKAELSLTKEQLSLTQLQSQLKDSIITEHVNKGILYEGRIENMQAKFDTQALFVKDLQKQNKKLKAKLTFTKITMGAIILTMGYLFITK